jgi:hypothetical protein
MSYRPCWPVEILKGISPVAWQHVNLYGRFEFNKRGKVDLATLVKIFDEPECWTRMTQQNMQGDYTPSIKRLDLRR